MDNRPIGIFDSGLGGLTVFKQIKKLIPKENMIYLGDTARVPYGTRSRETVIKFAIEDVNFLMKKDVKAIVIACNTASAYAFEDIKNTVNIPVFDVVSGATKEAVDRTRNKRIAVVGTSGTISSNSYEKQIVSLCSECKVFSKACPLLVPFIEEGETDGEAIDFIIDKYLSELINKDFDVLILGCTHYPLIADLIQTKVGNSVKLIDPGKSAAQKIQKFLNDNNLNTQANEPNYEFYLTDLNQNFSIISERFLGQKLDNCNRVEIE